MVFDDRVRRGLARIALAVAICLLTCVPLAAQTTSASLSGSVKDAQGAVVPGATVTLTSATQGTALTAVSDELGNFFFAYVRPDTYTLKVTPAAGFTGAKTLYMYAIDSKNATSPVFQNKGTWTITP